jgi:hypothetical protein
MQIQHSVASKNCRPNYRETERDLPGLFGGLKRFYRPAMSQGSQKLNARGCYAMIGFIIHRFVQSAGILMLTSVLVFCVVFAIGDPIQILVPADASPAEMAQAVHSLGLDQPMWRQYMLL